MTTMRRFWTAAGLMVLMTSVAQAQDAVRPAPEAATGFTEREEVTSETDMVVAAHPLAAEAGARMLREGGSAIDAMIATQLVLGLVEPQSSGIGGGAFLIHRDAASGRMIAYDGRETAPNAVGPDLFLDDSGQPLAFLDAVVGGRSVGTPGTVRLLELTHRLHGKLPWAQLFQPAIELAEDGFPVGERLAALVEGERETMRQDAIRDYFLPGGQPIAAGDTLTNPDYAATLRTIAEDGASSFYEGEIAGDIVAAVQGFEANPGLLEESDLADYRVLVREPVCAPFRAYEVCGMGPPSSGALTVGQILALLDHFDLESLDPLSAQATHFFAEASRLAYADRGLYMADPAFASVPTRGLLDPSYLTARAQLIDRSRAAEAVSAGNPPWREAAQRAPDRSLEIPSTSHVSIVDGEGNAVSLTTTIEAGFGSRLMVRGFLLNNELTDFSFVAEEDGATVANRVEGGKRPRSSMAPTIVLDASGEPVLVVGSPGGARIIPYVARTILGVLLWEMSPQDAVSMPHVTTLGGPLDLEEGRAPAGLADALTAMGHEVREMELNSGIHAIALEGGRLRAGVDPRREGAAVSSGDVSQGD
ncbi:gamma-glutamyltransferase [Aureimonas mangrovi]|uniref:gamma-glutamyltransferase n=1 Tax=Aureimonas mangrovi TaxID=2758041 RepID=UPI001AEDC923|nr:gamma-glutamyltransferase [Aureimonas mangrovi]